MMAEGADGSIWLRSINRQDGPSRYTQRLFACWLVLLVKCIRENGEFLGAWHGNLFGFFLFHQVLIQSVQVRRRLVRRTAAHTTMRCSRVDTTTRRPAGRPTTGIAGLITRQPLLQRRRRLRRPQRQQQLLLRLLPARHPSATTTTTSQTERSALWERLHPQLDQAAAAGPAIINCRGFRRLANLSSINNNTTAPIRRPLTALDTCRRHITAEHRQPTTAPISDCHFLRPAIPWHCRAPTRRVTTFSAAERIADSTTTPDASSNNNLTNNSSTSKFRQWRLKGQLLPVPVLDSNLISRYNNNNNNSR